MHEAIACKPVEDWTQNGTSLAGPQQARVGEKDLSSCFSKLSRSLLRVSN